MIKYKKHLFILIILILISLLVFFPYISGSRIFEFSADQTLQYNYFYKEWARMLKDFIYNKTFPFYSFNTYLGNNFYASKLYYLTGDIFMPVLLLFKNIELGLMWISVFLVVVSGFNFTLFIRKFGLKRESVIIASGIIYAFSGMACIYIGQYMFHRFYAFLPLLFYGVELYCREKKLFPFALIVTVLSLSSYYFLFPTSLFLVLYYFFTNYYHGREFKLFKIIKSALPLILAFLIGIMVAGILIVPGFLFVLGNDRIGTGTFKLVYDLKVYLGYVFNYICAPITLFTDYGYMFNSGANGHLTWYSIYTGALSAPIIFSMFKKPENRKDKALLVFECILLIASLTPAISSIFHGFSESSMRWMFLVTFFHTLVIAISLTHYENKINDFINGSKIYGIILGVSFVLTLFFVKLELNHLYVIIFSFGLFLFYTYMIKNNKLKYILIITCIEVILMNDFHLFLLSSKQYKYTPTLDENALNYYHDIDEDKFYRIYVSPNELLPSSALNLNQSINMNFNTTTTYDSMMETSLNEFNDLNGYNWHIIDINNYDVLKMLGVKYYFVSDEANLPSDNMTYYNNVNHLKMFKINDYLPIGFTYSKFKTNVNKEFNEEGIVVKHDLDFLSELLVDDTMYSNISDIKEGERNYFELIEFYNDNNLYGHILNETKQVLFFSIPYSEGWKVYDNEVQLKTYKVQGGFIGVILEAGDHYLTLRFTPQGFKQGGIVSVVGIVFMICLFIYDKRVKHHEKL